MPTGYTSIINDKGDQCTFADYLWRCARGFGALVMMRDAPMDAPITDEALSPSLSYYSQELTRAEALLAELHALSPAEIEERSRAEHEESVRRHLASLEEIAAERANYARMRAEVTAWSPPTPEHHKLKSFMLEQLEIGGPGKWEPSAPVSASPEEWHQKRIAEAKQSIERAQKYIAEEKGRAASRREWVEALRQSVPQPPAKDQP